MSISKKQAKKPQLRVMLVAFPTEKQWEEIKASARKQKMTVEYYAKQKFANPEYTRLELHRDSDDPKRVGVVLHGKAG